MLLLLFYSKVLLSTKQNIMHDFFAQLGEMMTDMFLSETAAFLRGVPSASHYNMYYNKYNMSSDREIDARRAVCTFTTAKIFFFQKSLGCSMWYFYSPLSCLVFFGVNRALQCCCIVLVLLYIYVTNCNCCSILHVKPL